MLEEVGGISPNRRLVALRPGVDRPLDDRGSRPPGGSRVIGALHLEVRRGEVVPRMPHRTPRPRPRQPWGLGRPGATRPPLDPNGGRRTPPAARGRGGGGGRHKEEEGEEEERGEKLVPAAPGGANVLMCLAEKTEFLAQVAGASA